MSESSETEGTEPETAISEEDMESVVGGLGAPGALGTFGEAGVGEAGVGEAI